MLSRQKNWVSISKSCIDWNIILADHQHEVFMTSGVDSSKHVIKSFNRHPLPQYQAPFTFYWI